MHPKDESLMVSFDVRLIYIMNEQRKIKITSEVTDEVASNKSPYHCVFKITPLEQESSALKSQGLF
jgi:hypothetical protein